MRKIYIDKHLFGLLNQLLLATAEHVEPYGQQTLQTSHVEACRHLHLLGRSPLALASLLALGFALNGRRDGGVLVLARHDQSHVVDLVGKHEVLLFFLE